MEREVEVLIVTGRTRHGKNKIHEHGDTWFVVRSGAVPLAASEQDGDVRWLLSEHFAIQRMGMRMIDGDSIAAQAIVRFSVGRMVRG